MQSAIVAGFILVTASCGERAGTAVAALPAAVPIPTPAAPGSGEPNLSTAPDGSVLLSWVEAADGGQALRFAVLGDSGWNEPRTIARGTDWFVNWADFPSLIQLHDGTLAAHWLQRSGDGTYAYGVRIARSQDGGA
ncbi:MAG: exo-alpha-sialidase, partial [Longimicrobiales bacterium]